MLQLHSVSNCRQGPVDISSGLVIVLKEKYTKQFQACTAAGVTTKTLFSLLSLQLKSTSRSFSQAIQDSIVVRDASLYCTDLQLDITIERFQSPLPLYYLWCLFFKVSGSLPHGHWKDWTAWASNIALGSDKLLKYYCSS